MGANPKERTTVECVFLVLDGFVAVEMYDSSSTDVLLSKKKRFDTRYLLARAIDDAIKIAIGDFSSLRWSL